MPSVYNKVGVASASDAGTGGERSQGDVLDFFGAVLTFLSVLFILLTFPFTLWSCVTVVLEYERAVIFRLGQVVKGPAKGPGLIWFIPWLDIVHKVDLRTVSFIFQPQTVLTLDNVPLMVKAAVFYRVVDPILWLTQVKNGCEATHWLAQTTLRATLGAHTLTELLMQSPTITRRMEEVLHSGSRPWGVQVQQVALRDLKLPTRLQRCMASEAEAVRTARSKMIVAEGEVKASHTLKEAASGLSSVGLQIRLLQTLSSARKDASIVVVCFPMELLDMFLAQSP
ncbi:mechanosensory protein 2 [Anableps anableps]